MPPIMLTADEAACVEAKAVSPRLVTVAVKRATGRNSARCLPPDEAHTKMRQGASRATAKAAGLSPKRVALPAAIEVTFYRSDHADAAASLAGLERVDARTVRTVAPTARDLYVAMPPG